MIALFVNLGELAYAVKHENMYFFALKLVINPKYWRLRMDVTRTITQLRPDEPIQYQLSRAICHGWEGFFLSRKKLFLSRKKM